MKTFKLYLIRHGITQGNLDGIYMGGGLDQPLAEAGAEQLRQMKALYTYPNVGVLFTSPMQRAVQSADILFPDIQKRYEIEDLRECRFGVFEGRDAKELAKDPDFAKWLDPESEFVPEGGESGKDFSARCSRALMGMMEFLIKSGITEGACVTHGGVIMSMLAQKALPQQPMVGWMTGNGAGFAVQTSTAMFMRDKMVEALGVIPIGYEQNTPVPGHE